MEVAGLPLFRSRTNTAARDNDPVGGAATSGDSAQPARTRENPQGGTPLWKSGPATVIRAYATLSGPMLVSLARFCTLRRRRELLTHRFYRSWPVRAPAHRSGARLSHQQ